MVLKENLKGIFEEFSKLLDPVIRELLISSDDSRRHEAIKYQMTTDGKKVRPVFAMLICHLMGGKVKDILYPATGAEILHNYTLIIDDVIDHSYFRRNLPTVWKKYGISMADLFAMYYAASIFQALSSNKHGLKLVEIFAKTLKEVTDGQILDVLYEKSGRDNEPYVVENRYSIVTLQDYIEMIGKKTASLFCSCAEVGGVCAGANDHNLSSLKKFGFDFGLAFQIRDDILDIFGDEKTFGKEIGKDIKERKVSNIVIMITLEELQKADKIKLEKIFQKSEIVDADVTEAIMLINKTKAREMAQKMAEEFMYKAKATLKSLPQNKWNNTLADLSDYIIQREK